MDKLFHGDINTVPIPEGETGTLELGGGLALEYHFGEQCRVLQFPISGHEVWQYSNEWDTLRTLFLRQPSEDEDAE